MGVYIDSSIEALKKSLNIDLWLHFVLANIVYGLVFCIIAVVFALISIPVLSLVVGVDLFSLITSALTMNSQYYALSSSLSAALSNPSVFTALTGVFLVLLIVFILIAAFIGALFEGIFFFMGRSFLDSGKPDFGGAFESSKKRFFALFKVNLVIGIIVGLFALLVFLPLLISLPSTVSAITQASAASTAGVSSASSAVAIMGFLLIMLGGMFVLGVVLFFAAPYLSMMVPVVLFEKLGTIDSIRRGIEIVNGKYWGNFGFLLLTLILGMVVGFIVSLFLMIFMFLAMLVFAFILIYYILIIAFSIWQQSWMTIAYITLYDINSGGSGKRKPRHSFVGMSR